MEIRPIHTDADYRAVLREVSAFFENEPEPGSPEGDRFEVQVTLLEAYEAKHFPIDLPDPVEAIKFRMEQAGLAPKDLVPAIGRLNRVEALRDKSAGSREINEVGNCFIERKLIADKGREVSFTFACSAESARPTAPLTEMIIGPITVRTISSHVRTG